MGKNKRNEAVIEDDDEVLNKVQEEKERVAREKEEAEKKMSESIDDESEEEEEEEKGGCEGCKGCHGKCAKKKKGGKKAKKGKKIPDAIKIVGLAAMIPLVFFLPRLLVWTCIVVNKMPKYTLHGIWVVYALLEALAYFGVHRGKMTADSFLTQQSIYILFAMGAYNFLHIANSVPFQYRQIALRVWLTLTNVINVVVLYLDNTDYARKERKEKERARRREERNKEAEEKYRQLKAEREEKNPPWYKRNARIKFISDAAVYLVLILVVLKIGQAFLNYKAEFDKGFNQEESWGYEGHTGADYEGTKVEDYELNEATIKTAAEQPADTPAENVEL